LANTPLGSAFISKSKYLSGLQCAKLLWHQYNAKDKFPPRGQSEQARFDQGHLVGEQAKALFPGGIEVGGYGQDFDEALQRSREALGQRKPLFEPAFMHKHAYARADILNPVGSNRWDIIEAKSSATLKPVYLDDLALQWYVYKGTGLKIRKCFILCINSKYMRRGEVNPAKLFTKVDVTREVSRRLNRVGRSINKMLKTLQLKKTPEISIGLQCDDPYPCPLHDMCWDFLPANSIFTLYSFRRKKSFDLLRRHIIDILDVPENVPLTAKQKIQMEALRTRKPHVGKDQIDEFLRSLVYPLYFLDFETFGTAIPLLDNVRPFQQVPFQFSLNVVRSQGSNPEHYGFLAEGTADPRPQLLEQLRSLLGDQGSIVSYNIVFERGRLKECAAVFKEFELWRRDIAVRFVDLMQPFRKFAYYHPDQKGSASLKSVLPALTGNGYDQLEIADGGTASLEYLRVTYQDVGDAERARVRKLLEDYCTLDTLGMVRVVEALQQLLRVDMERLSGLTRYGDCEAKEPFIDHESQHGVSKSNRS
jgi:hypothetical protein